MKDKKDEARQIALADLESFIRLVHPKRVLGSVHSEVIRWWNREEAKTHQLLLMPRDHQKSALVAYRVAWEITKRPWVKVLYISATANLATKQLKFIKDILTDPRYRFYWPDMINPEEGKREKWTESEISVDHPSRFAENVRDPTVFTGGLTTTITGLHCDIAVLDDIVVRENAYTEEGRTKVEEQYSQLASIEGSDSVEWVVGTRYHPKDLYNTLLGRTVEIFDHNGDPIGEPEPLYEVREYTVESRGDGTGEYLWPRQQRHDGKWFGFNQEILAKKKAAYLDPVQFRAQYYNDPNDSENSTIGRDLFQYFNRPDVIRVSGKWQIKGRPLNVFAAVDFAYSLKSKADYTAVVVVGVDAHQNYYVLDIERFKANKPSDYYKIILQLHQKWDFRKLRAEITAAQEAIVEDLKYSYIQRDGLALTIDGHRPTRNEGTKAERILSTLQGRYQNRQIWHYQGGHCQTLEEELVLRHPPHDDIKDCLASCVDICIAPTAQRFSSVSPGAGMYHARFGGVT